MRHKRFRPEQLKISAEEWQQTPANVQAVVQQLKAEVEKLREQMGLNSENSSQPPSSDKPHQEHESKRIPTGRKRGGQVGHPGHYRRLIAAEQVSKVVIHKPSHCQHCQTVLEGEDLVPYRWQITELPPINPVVIEHQVHRLVCPACGKRTRANLPPSVRKSQFGERLSSFLSLLMGQYRLSKRQVVRLLKEGFQIDISLGSIINRQSEMVQALEVPMRSITEMVQNTAVRGIDETSWREDRQRVYLWSVTTAKATLFRIADSRGSQVARDLLGEDSGRVSISDRHTAYTWLPLEQHQTCWAHLLRGWKRMVSRGGDSAEVGQWLVIYTEYLLHRWGQVRDGTLSRAEFLAEVPQHQQVIETWLKRGTQVEHPRTAGTCRRLLRCNPMLWTFTRDEGVEPTNNATERALRHPVIWRKLCHGTDSKQGSRFVERILTTLTTCRQQAQPAFDFLYQALTTQRQNLPAPLLLPIAYQERR